MSPKPSVPPLASLLAGRAEPGHATASGPVSDELSGRLSAEDVAAVEAALEGQALDVWNASPPEARGRLAVVLGVHYGIPAVLEKTGLLDVVPPEEIHAMARGPLAAGGELYTADVVVKTLLDLGMSLSEGMRILDFGCSSGRVLRALAGYRPDLELLGCDPNHDAVAWANANLPIGRFFPSEKHPPLDLDDASVDVAFAISIWSHFAAEPALEWLEEMRRVLVPGGLLLITTHGWDSLANGIRREAVGLSAVQAAVETMVTDGHYFIDVFGEDGDWGVDKAGWGNSYLTLDWLATRMHSRWSIRAFLPGGLDHYQDVIVLQRVV